MKIVDVVFQLVKETTSLFVSEAWQSQDLSHMTYASGRLVELNARAATASEIERRECREKASQHLDDIKALAQSRVSQAEKHLEDQIEKALISTLITVLSPHIALVISIIKVVS